MKSSSMHRVTFASLAIGLAAATAFSTSGPGGVEWRLEPISTVVEALPPLPSPDVLPIQLVLDDDSADGNFGVAGQTARQFLWFNRFSTGEGFHLEEIWVLFPQSANVVVGGAVQIAIYVDPDGDPSNGATLLQSFDTTIQVADGNTFSIYPLASSLSFPAAAEILVGVVPRFIVSGVTAPTSPAALDTTATQSRSWLAIWSTDPPDPPSLVPVPDQAIGLVDGFVPGGGNWMIRAFGTRQSVVEVPTLDSVGLASFVALLTALSLVAIRRRQV
ncbi:MAG: hypothetical protein ABI639_05135 [Thermoanaerobaculia bacterium]